LSNWTFAFPERIHLIWPAAAFMCLAVWLEFFRVKKLEVFISPAMGQRLVRRMPLWRRAAKLCLTAAFLTFGILALMRPQSSRSDENVWAKEAAAEIMVVLDVSRSMLAEDAAPNRLERAKAELRDLARELVGHRMGLIAFAGRAVIMSPMTADRSFFQLVLSGVDENTVSKGGTRIGDAILKAVKGFSPGPGAKLVVLITDGEDHDSFPMDAAKEARDRGVRIVSIGFGSETGSRIMVTDRKTGERKELVDRLGNPVISKLDGAMLRDIALATEGVYVPAGVGVLDLESIIDSHVAPLIKEAGLVKTQTVRTERYPLWLSSAFLALMLAVWMGSGVGGSLEGKPGAGFAALFLACSLAVAPMAARAQNNPHDNPPNSQSGQAEKQSASDSGPGNAAEPTDQAGQADSKAAAPESAEPPEPKDDRTPREIYNDALDALNSGKLDEAEKGFLKARDQAAADGELRFRAAFNLGSTYSAKADSKDGEGVEAVLDELRSAAAWFRDSIRLRESEEDARVNLEIVLKRIQQLADQLNQGENGLEPRLDRLIVDQRDLRNQLRNLMQSVHDAGADADPVAFEATYHSLSARQRELLADSDTVAFMADEEIGKLESTPEEEREEKDAVRLVQLQSMLIFLNRGRDQMADVRLRLRKLRGDDAHEGSSNAVDFLKRAREQLMGPTEILQRLLQDQSMLHMQTNALKAPIKTAVSTEGEESLPEIPKWLNTEFLDAREADIQERANEVTMRMTAGVEQQEAKVLDEDGEDKPGQNAAPTADGHGKSHEDDENFQKMLKAAKESLPYLNEGLSFMGKAREALKEKRIHEALGNEEEAANALAAALERFADLKQLIEMSYAEQARIVAFLDPSAQQHEAAQIPPEEKARQTAEGIRRNMDRLKRLGGLFQEELAKLEQAPAPEKTAGQDKDEADNGHADQAAMEKQKYELAENFRLSALAAVEKTAELLTQESASATDAKSSADQALSDLEELRKLFFTLIEHLKQLVRDQGETMDMTASASAENTEAEELAAELVPTVSRQNNHSLMAGQIAEVLKKQGEQHSAKPAFTNKTISGQPQAKGPDYAKAGDEVGQARENMIDAANGMVAEKPGIEEILDNQKTALEHLQAALNILNPPQKQKEKDGDKKQQEQKQQQQQGQKEKQKQKDKEAERKMSKEQAERRLQSIRDKEMQRRERDNREAPAETVEKDW